MCPSTKGLLPDSMSSMVIPIHKVPRKKCRRTYVAINKLITKSYKNTIKTDDAIHASIIAECIKIRDNTMTCGTMKQCYANDIVMYLTTM